MNSNDCYTTKCKEILICSRCDCKTCTCEINTEVNKSLNENSPYHDENSSSGQVPMQTSVLFNISPNKVNSNNCNVSSINSLSTCGNCLKLIRSHQSAKTCENCDLDFHVSCVDIGTNEKSWWCNHCFTRAALNELPFGDTFVLLVRVYDLHTLILEVSETKLIIFNSL